MHAVFSSAANALPYARALRTQHSLVRDGRADREAAGRRRPGHAALRDGCRAL